MSCNWRLTLKGCSENRRAILNWNSPINPGKSLYRPMIITERFVFIHMHKTGGQTLNDIITSCIADSHVVGYHYPRNCIPVASTDLPVVGIVRNPWDWYVSWYAFNRRPSIRNALFNIVSAEGRADFKTTVENLSQLGSDRQVSRQHRENLIAILPDSLDANRGVGLTKKCIRELSDSETGYYSWQINRMLGDSSNGDALIGRYENLQDDFLHIMTTLAVKEVDAMGLEFKQRERKNTSRHSHYSHYYDNELSRLVGDKEMRVAERFAYAFDAIKPAGAAYGFSLDTNGSVEQGFRKLIGREKNYLQLKESIDIGKLKTRVEQFPDAKWRESERERLFDVHRDTQALLLVHFEDFKYEQPEYRELFAELQDELQPVIDYIADYYQGNGFVLRVLLAKLRAGGKIPHHTDAGFSLLNCHRVHIPIVTNDDVIFFVGGEEKNMQVGELWEINNGLDHAVENRGYEDRIHLIIDWMPNHSAKSEAAVLAPEQTGEGINRRVDPATLNAMVAQGYKLHQAGQVAKAESQYRQVLHQDKRHVVANNLLGLLCLHTKRFAEAAQYIERALTEKPDDAQAHANLGLALKDLQKPDEAALQFHASLKLDPNNPRVYNNLGSVYMTLRRIEDAIRSFRLALVIQPSFAEVHYNLGAALLQLRRYEEAATSLRQCLTLKPDLADAEVKLQQALKGQRN